MSCYFCVEGKLCCDCTLQLSEEGLCKICPICRQIKWKNRIIKSTKIIPTNVQADEETENTDIKSITCEEWCIFLHEVWRRILTIVGFWVVLYGAGLLTIAMFCSKETFQTSSFIWIIALFVGILEFILIWFCCCSHIKVCENE